jgi:urease accessory protein
MPPRAVGAALVSCKRRDGRTVLDGLYQKGSMKLLFARRGAGDSDLTGILLNTAGGVTGGDRFRTEVRLGPDCRMTLTTQAAERAYRAQPGEVAKLRNRISLASNARMRWLPQETLIYDRSALRRSLDIDLAQGSRLLAVEPVVFGRAAMGELLHHISFRDGIDVRRDGRLVFADRTALKGTARDLLCNKAIAAGAGAMASLLLVADDAERFLAPAQALMPATGGVSLIRQGVLFARLLAADGYQLRQTLLPLIELLGGAPLPRTWML